MALEIIESSLIKNVSEFTRRK